MDKIIEKLFQYLAIYFDKIPLLSKIKGFRTILGFAGLAVVTGLKSYDIGDPEILNAIEAGFIIFTGLALNSKGR